jgi:PAS domain S-box-containing protein
MSQDSDHTSLDRPLPTATDFPPSPDTVELAALRAIVEGTATSTGDEFFRTLVRNLSLATGIPNAFVAEFAGSTARARTIAFFSEGQIRPNFEWELAETPCEDVLRGALCHHPTGVSTRFPKEVGVESFLGVPLRDSSGTVLGHLAVYDSRPMPEEPRLLYTFRIFAARAAVELDRLRSEQRLHESEQRLRDLFDEAPIAYVHEDLESRFLSANRAATRILGITPEEVPSTVGMSFVPQTPEAQRRVQEAFAAIGRGADTGGVLLELRRRDNGRPIWIQWWSRPDPGGKFTRTMFIDVTERVLLEQEQARLRAQNAYLQEEIKAHHNFEEIVGRSAALAAVLNNVRRVAATDASVLIRGETGTGKELIARAIHSTSRRHDKPLIKINCAALPAGLVESELFGHEKGAFTGAIAKRLGRFELADGGTIFLDEVGEIPLDAQAKLLRTLQEREIDRVGGKSPIKVDVRVIAATNRDLATAVAQKTFREDLFYRLNVFPIALPALRERAEDIPVLVQFFLEKFATRLGKRLEGVSTDAMQRLQSYAWPGNIRELENVLERAVILADGPLVDIDRSTISGKASVETAPMPSNGDVSLEAIERQHILTVLRQADWVIEGPKGAARQLQLHPNTLRSRMKKLRISRGDAE